MEILKQCQQWHEDDEFQKIVDALEAIPSGERTPEMDCELARAYNNLAVYSNLAESGHENYHDNYTGRNMLKKALVLLKPHEKYFMGDSSWNFRVGYAYYYLDQEGRALSYFQKSLEVSPDKEDAKYFINQCKENISLPKFSMCFQERTEIWWKTFAELQTELCQLIEDNMLLTCSGEILDQLDKSLHMVFDEISFEIGINGEKYELILTPEGDKVKLFELVYFKDHAPNEVFEHWNIFVGRQPFQNKGSLVYGGNDISADDVQVWLEKQDENCFIISAYCEKLLPMLSEKAGEAWWLLFTLTDQVLGEISHMWYFSDFQVLENPKEVPYILMSQLPGKLEEKGIQIPADPKVYLESYFSYEMDPNGDKDANTYWRSDVIAGTTNCAPLIAGYLDANNDFVDMLHADGAVAGFFCYPLDELKDEEGTGKIFDFRDSLMTYLTEHCRDALTFTGVATGIYYGYVDFIAWDIQTTLQVAKSFFEDSCIPWAKFNTFRREADAVSLKNQNIDKN